MLPAVLDQTILATALPTIAGDLGVLADVSWIVTAYVVAAAATTPLWGKLGDRHGRKRLLEVALGLFVLASAACGLAGDVTTLVAARAVQGVAAGGLMSLAMAAVGDLVEPRERARFQGFIAATFAVATVAGPLVGGGLVEHADWRWVFYVNLPLGLVALAGLHRFLPSVAPPPASERAPLDGAGAALLAGATVALMLACVWGGDRYAWGSPVIVGLLAGALVLAVAFLRRERRAQDPVLPLALLRRRTVAHASGALFLATSAIFAVMVFVPLMLQVDTGATPVEAGLLLVPMMVGITVSTSVAGRVIGRTGRYKAFPVGGLAVMAGALALLGATAQDASRPLVALGLMLFGLGFGVVGQVLVAAVQNDVDRRQLGVAMAATSFFRGLGGAVGAAVLGAVFAAQVGTSAHSASPAADVGRATQVVLLVAAAICVVAVLVAARLDEPPLRSAAPPTGAAA
jgi:EmrB/QacA subfamily drug resistance transporter